MDEPRIPPELAELERRIAGLPAPEPPPALRERVGRAVAGSLRQERSAVRWAFAGAAAAAAAVLLNLSMTAGLETGIGPGREMPLAGIAEMTARIQEAAPEIPEREARRQAAALIAALAAPAAAPRLPSEALRGFIGNRKTRGD